LDLELARDVEGVSLHGLKRRGVDVRVVVHCAAVFNTDSETRTECGGDPTAVVNFHNLTRLNERLVQEMLKESPDTPKRVVFIGSFVHQCLTSRMLGFDAFKRWHRSRGVSEQYYNPALAYAWSKVAISAYAVAKHRQWMKLYGGALTSVLVDPGMVDTRLIRGWPGALQLLFRFGGQSLGLLQSPAAAARGVVDALCREPGEVTCPHIYGPTYSTLGNSYWMDDEQTQALVAPGD
jgi:hypothetical protein